MKAIERALERISPPTQAELARQLHTTPQEVNRWFGRGWAAPKYAPAIERLTGVSCSDLIEDIERSKSS